MLLHAAMVLAAATLSLAASPLTGENAEQVEIKPEETSKYCSCSGPYCQCCVDFNITYIDLGGPGCVKMKYISPDQGVSVNVSYGDSQLHQGNITGDNTTATCMDILLDLAQMCASFNGITKTEDGLRACVSLEPTLLGDPQDSYHLGCFDMGQQGMRIINTSSSPQQTSQTAEPEKPVNEESLIAAVNESAEEGIAWFSSFLGFSFDDGKSNSTETSNV